MIRFNPLELRPGYILHQIQLHNGVRDTRRVFGFPGSTVQRMLGDECGCHDALILVDKSDPRLDRHHGYGAGDMIPLRGRVTPLSNYEDRINRGEIAVRIFAPHDYDEEAGYMAGRWWLKHEVGNAYNLLAYPRLIIKAAAGDDMQWSRDIKWDWCTETCMWAWLLGPSWLPNPAHLPPIGQRKHDYWRKPGDTRHNTLRPTPLTTWHRFRNGIFKDVTGECMIDVSDDNTQTIDAAAVYPAIA